MNVDPRAASGFASVADAYQQGRPTYPTQMIDQIMTSLDLDDTSSVLDLAAGTGQLSRLLQRQVERMIAVEPVATMRAKIAADVPTVQVVDGTAEAIPLEDATVDAVVVGEAFHWFSTVTAAAEIARVLVPLGRVALLWNTPTWTADTVPWLDDFRRIIAHHRAAAGTYPAGERSWQEPLEKTGLFERPTHLEATHTQTLDCEGFLAQMASWSWIANLDDHQRTTVLDNVRLTLRDAGNIVIPYRTDLYLMHRRATPNRVISSSG